MASNRCELEPMYKLYKNVSEIPLIACAVANKRKPKNNPLHGFF